MTMHVSQGPPHPEVVLKPVVQDSVPSGELVAAHQPLDIEKLSRYKLIHHYSSRLDKS